MYEQGGGVRCLMSTAASAFPKRPCVDLYSVLGDSGCKRESADAILARHDDEGSFVREAAHWPDPDLERALPARGGWVG